MIRVGTIGRRGLIAGIAGARCCNGQNKDTAELTINHPNTLIGDLEPNFATQTNDDADVVL